MISCCLLTWNSFITFLLCIKESNIGALRHPHLSELLILILTYRGWHLYVLVILSWQVLVHCWWIGILQEKTQMFSSKVSHTVLSKDVANMEYCGSPRGLWVQGLLHTQLPPSLLVLLPSLLPFVRQEVASGDLGRQGLRESWHLSRIYLFSQSHRNCTSWSPTLGLNHPPVSSSWNPRWALPRLA